LKKQRPHKRIRAIMLRHFSLDANQPCEVVVTMFGFKRTRCHSDSHSACLPLSMLWYLKKIHTWN